MNIKEKRASIAIALAICVFFGLSAITNTLHDFMFLEHTSIKDGVTVCSGSGPTFECETEDGVRAYNSSIWSFLGTTVAFIMLAIRVMIAFLTYKIIYPVKKQPTQTAHIADGKLQSIINQISSTNCELNTASHINSLNMAESAVQKLVDLVENSTDLRPNEQEWLLEILREAQSALIGSDTLEIRTLRSQLKLAAAENYLESVLAGT